MDTNASAGEETQATHAGHTDRLAHGLGVLSHVPGVGATAAAVHRAATAAGAALWALLAALAGAVLLYRLSARPRYDLDRMPGPWRHAWPLAGNIPQLLRPDFHRVLLRWADKYGGVIRVNFLWQDAVMVTDPAAVAVIVGRGEGALDKAAGIYSPINIMCTSRGHANLLTSAADERWKAVRKAVALSFAFGNIRKKFPVIRERTLDLVSWLRGLGPGASVDVDQAALRVTLDVIGLAAFGHDYGCVRLAEVPREHLLRVLPRAFTEVMRRIANPARGLAPALFKNGVKGRQSFADFQAHMRELLRGIQARGPPPPGDNDIGAQLYRVLAAAKGENAKSGQGGWWRRAPQGLCEERILSEIGILFVEGFETTGHTISWTLFNIATSPGVQERCAAELASLGLLVRGRGAEGGARALELEDLKRMPYITACVKESMRMFPVVSIMGRVCDKPTRIGPYTVPAGTPVGVPLFAIQNTVHNWKDPEVCRPERWLDVPVETYVVDMRPKEGIPTTGVTAAAQPAKAAGATTSHTAPALAPAGPSDVSGLAQQPSAAKRRPSSDSDDDGADVHGGGGGKLGGISFMPFSEGPRSCVGQSLAKLEVLTVLATLLAHFRLELAEEMGGRAGVRRLESTHLTLQTRGTRGIRMHLHPREAEAEQAGQAAAARAGGA